MRVQAAGNNTELRTGLKHPETGNLQAQVLFVGIFHQCIQHRVIEYLPPLTCGGWLVVNSRGILACPLISYLCIRSLEVRACHGAAAAQDDSQQRQTAYC